MNREENMEKMELAGKTAGTMLEERPTENKGQWIERTKLLHLLEELTSVREPRPEAAPLGAGDRLSRLTQREREVADLIASGASNREIALQLHVTEATVKAHLTATFRKLGVTDRLQLGLFLTRHAGVPANA